MQSYSRAPACVRTILFLYAISLKRNNTFGFDLSMKIDINKIDVGRFAIREEIDQEYLERLTQSLLDDGQWHPIIVRRINGGRYQLVAGHYRLQASIKAGLKEIEANIRDLTDEDADLLSLKTNMLRQEMTPREQGRALSKMMENYGWSQTEIARKLSVESKWVGRRLRVALELHEEVAKTLDNGRISFSVASVIGGVPIDEQPMLLKIVLERGVTEMNEAGVLRRQLLNDTIYTIGYQGHTLTTFINTLKDNNIEFLMDVRFSSESQYKPEFNGTILQRELERENIKYSHKAEFGLPYLIQNPYKDGALGYDCVKQWYSWHISSETDFHGFVEELKKSGRTVLMCMEQYAKSNGRQKYACHRDILADLVLEYKTEDKLLKFRNRIYL